MAVKLIRPWAGNRPGLTVRTSDDTERQLLAEGYAVSLNGAPVVKEAERKPTDNDEHWPI